MQRIRSFFKSIGNTQRNKSKTIRQYDKIDALTPTLTYITLKSENQGTAKLSTSKQDESVRESSTNELREFEPISLNDVTFYRTSIKFDRQTKTLEIADCKGKQLCSLEYSDYQQMGTTCFAFKAINRSSQEKFDVSVLVPITCCSTELNDTDQLIFEGSNAVVMISQSDQLIMKIMSTNDSGLVMVSFSNRNDPAGLNLEFLCRIEVLKDTKEILTNSEFQTSKLTEEDHRRVIKYLEYIEETVPKKAKRLNSCDQLAIESAFNTKFHKSKAFAEFEKYVKNCSTKWIGNEILAPIGSIIQSSGHGKTRSMAEFAKRHFSIYICLRGPNEDGYPKRSKYISDQLMSSLNKTTTASKFFFALIQTAHHFITYVITGTTEQKAKQFCEYQPWRNDSNLKSDKFLETFKHAYNEAQKFSEKQQKELVTKYLAAIPGGLFIFMDEARCLFNENSYEQVNKFTVMRQSIMSLLRGQSIALILADTQSQLSHSVHCQSNLVGTERSVFKPLYEPFFKILYINSIDHIKETENTNRSLVNDYNAFMKLKSVSYEYLKTINSLHTSFLLGRPLWLTLSAYGYDSLIQLATSKLINRGERTWSSVEKSHQLYAALAIICSRTTLSTYSKLHVGTELVARHMSTLYWISEDSADIAFRYISEPILAQAAATLMTDQDNLADMLNLVGNYLAAMSLNFSGSIREVVAQLIILLALDEAVINKSDKNRTRRLLKSITVEEFLTVLLGEERFNEMKLDDETKESLVYFNHFVRVLGDLSESDVHRLFKSGAAVQYKTNNPRFNLAVFYLRRDGVISAIRFQIKNWDKPVPVRELQSMVPIPLKHKDQERAIPYISILMNLGSGKMTESAIFETTTVSEYIVKKKTYPMPKFHNLGDDKITHYQVNGLSCSAYPILKSSKLIKTLNGLVSLCCLKKSSLESAFGKMVIDKVFSSSITTGDVKKSKERYF